MVSSGDIQQGKFQPPAPVAAPFSWGSPALAPSHPQVLYVGHAQARAKLGQEQLHCLEMRKDPGNAMGIQGDKFMVPSLPIAITALLHQSQC